MSYDHQHERDGDKVSNFRMKWVFVGFFLIAAYFLVTEHQAHLYGWFATYGIWLLLLACPLMHLFMHGGHGGHGRHRDNDAAASDRPRKE
jgi:hypothetical protein